MKKALLSSLLLLAATVASAQENVKGDMNGDDEISVADVTSLVEVALGRSPKQTISLGVDPYKVDNTLVVGMWYAPDGTSFTLSEDGTTTYPGAATYKFRYHVGMLTFYDASGKAVKVLGVVETDPSYLLLLDYATGACTYYTNSSALVSAIAMSEPTLSLNSGATAQLTVSVTPPDALSTSVVWSSSNETVATVDQNGLVTAVAGGTCTITATATDVSGKTATCEVTVIQLVTSIELSQTSVVLEKDAVVRLTATVLPVNASNKNIVWKSDNESVAGVIQGAVVAMGGYGTAIITCEAADGSGIKAICSIFVPEYVDLGLPSGTLWATCNIGASSPEDYGDYFAWGETTGYNDGKTIFDWSTYKWCNGDWNKQTKYCPNSEYGNNGYTDNLKELESADDAAYVNWGPAWRMPSKEQLAELINSSYTTTTWTTQNGVNGLLITSNTNGNSVFLPAAGYRKGGSLIYAGSKGYCLSRTLYEYGPNLARSLYFYSSDIDTENYYRYLGVSVRPVRSSE